MTNFGVKSFFLRLASHASIDWYDLGHVIDRKPRKEEFPHHFGTVTSLDRAVPEFPEHGLRHAQNPLTIGLGIIHRPSRCLVNQQPAVRVGSDRLRFIETLLDKGAEIAQVLLCLTALP